MNIFNLFCFQKIWCYLFSRPIAGHYTDATNWISVSLGVVFSVLSVSRIIAIYQGQF